MECISYNYKLVYEKKLVKQRLLLYLFPDCSVCIVLQYG